MRFAMGAREVPITNLQAFFRIELNRLRLVDRLNISCEPELNELILQDCKLTRIFFSFTSRQFSFNRLQFYQITDSLEISNVFSFVRTYLNSMCYNI